ncbi:MAG TPA: hypothetical protein PLV25_05840, partial [Opitutales bacterium]|nr:hypothetical protein [Opitutales bacterium]
MHCPKCGSKLRIKNGTPEGRQRYRCKHCGCNYTRSTARGVSTHKKRLAIQWILEGMSFSEVARNLDVSNVSVMRWAHTAAPLLAQAGLGSPKPNYPSSIDLDALITYLSKNQKNLGHGILSLQNKAVPSGIIT